MTSANSTPTILRKAEMKKLLATLALVAACGAPALANPFSFDVMATGMPAGISSTSPLPSEVNTHYGIAIGPRFGKRLALVPLVNYIPQDANRKGTFRPGLALVYGITRRVDIGIAEIMRPEDQVLLKPGPTPFAPAVVLGIRL